METRRARPDRAVSRLSRIGASATPLPTSNCKGRRNSSSIFARHKVNLDRADERCSLSARLL